MPGPEAEHDTWQWIEELNLPDGRGKTLAETLRCMDELEKWMAQFDERGGGEIRTLSVEEYAQLCGVTPRTIRNWRKAGEVAAGPRGCVSITAAEHAFLMGQAIIKRHSKSFSPIPDWALTEGTKELVDRYGIEGLIARLAGDKGKDPPSRRTVVRWLKGECIPKGDLRRRVRTLALQDIENGNNGGQMSFDLGL